MKGVDGHPADRRSVQLWRDSADPGLSTKSNGTGHSRS